MILRRKEMKLARNKTRHRSNKSERPRTEMKHRSFEMKRGSIRRKLQCFQMTLGRIGTMRARMENERPTIESSRRRYQLFQPPYGVR